MLAAVGNSLVWGSLSFLQFHAHLPVAEGGFGLTQFEVGLIWGFSAAVGAVSNVLWGALSDRTHTRWGKRKPFLVVFPAITAVLLWVAVNVDVLFGVELAFWNLLVWYALHKVAHSGANTPYSAIIPEIVPPKDRVGISQMSALFNGIGMALGALVPTLLFETMPTFAGPFLVLGAGLVISYLIILPAIPESRYEVTPVSVVDSIRTTFRDRNFLKFEVAQLSWSLGLNIVLFILPFLAHDVLAITDEAGYGWLMVTFLLIAGVFLFFSGWVTERFQVKKKAALMFSLVFTAAALPFLGLLGSDLLAPVPLLTQVYVMGGVAFFGLVGLFVFPYAIFMALINRDYGTEATYNGANNFVVGLAQIPAGPVGGALLAAFGYEWIGAFCAAFMVVSIVLCSRVHAPETLFQDEGTGEGETGTGEKGTGSGEDEEKTGEAE